MLPFWVSWSMGNLKAGQGNLIDEKTIMKWTDSDPLSVSVISISTGWEATGIWELSNFQGNITNVLVYTITSIVYLILDNNCTLFVMHTSS